MITARVEELYGLVWKETAEREGHRAKLPPNVLTIQEKAYIQNGRMSLEYNESVLNAIKPGEKVNVRILSDRLPGIDGHAIERTLYRLKSLGIISRHPIRNAHGKVLHSLYMLTGKSDG